MATLPVLHSDLTEKFAALTRQREESGTPDLIKAVKENDLAKVRTLVATAKIEAFDLSGATAFFWAAARGYVEIGAFLLDHGAEINTRDNAGTPAILTAADGKHDDFIRLMIAHKADINAAQSTTKQTALIELAYDGSPEIIKDLICGGADAKAKNVYDATAQSRAQHQHRDDVLRLLADAPSLRFQYLQEQETKRRAAADEAIRTCTIIPAGTPVISRFVPKNRKQGKTP